MNANARLSRLYFNFAQTVFFVYLLGILSFGRAFAVLNIPWKSFPVYTTEIVIMLLMPLLLSHGKDIRRVPKMFWLSGGMFLGMSVIYFLWALSSGKHFAVRDVVYAIYPLFMPLTVILFGEEKNFRKILFVMILGNILALILGRYIIFDQGYFPAAEDFIYNSRTFNLGLYFGLTTAGLVSLFIFTERRFSRILEVALFFILSLNIYMILIFGIRSAWLALLGMVLFIVGASPRVAGKFLLKFLPWGLLLGLLFYYFDFKMVPSDDLPVCVAKFKGWKNYVKNRTEEIPLAADRVAAVVHPPQQIGYNSSAQSVQTKTDLSGSPFGDNSPVQKAQPAGSPAAVPANLEENHAADIREANDNIRWRFQIWQQTIEFGRQSPVWGQGFGVYPHYNIWGNTGLDIKGVGAGSGLLPAHNHVLTIFYKMGVVGILAFVMLNFFVFWHGFKRLARSRSWKTKSVILAALSGLVYWHIMAFFFDVIDSPPTNIFLWILIGLIFAARVFEEDKSAERIST